MLASSAPLVPTWGLQAMAVAVLVVAGVSGRAASPRHPGAGMLCVASLFVVAALLAVLAYRLGH